MTGEREPEKAARVLLEAGVKLVVVTLGAKGAFYCTKDAQGTVPGFKVRVADTNGAGDILRGADWGNCRKRRLGEYYRGEA